MALLFSAASGAFLDEAFCPVRMKTHRYDYDEML